ncbi:hypothetical protein PHAVU_003G121100 [Phaseolus vulgaris]|uniref:Uncharacterized protein n=1 Tax=Phaseolus vulgaris TaxID=3885 RepID=V7CB08_PHAVU|nr:hypothetical protein PHAVU_003G121100g [Phaseolus vulgaris]ESW26455.1 hypothetical protein PHAVU_003G121100g [Phaseolus vulgaris]
MGLCSQCKKWTFSEQQHSPLLTETERRRTQEAHEIVRRGKWCGWVNNKAWNYQW